MLLLTACDVVYLTSSSTTSSSDEIIGLSCLIRVGVGSQVVV